MIRENTDDYVMEEALADHPREPYIGKTANLSPASVSSALE
jgi:hypothetical protein